MLVAVNVFVVARSAPAAKYASWISETISGCVRFSRSGSPCDVARVIAEQLAAILLLRQPAAVDEHAPRAVVHDDSPVEDLLS